MNVRNQADTNPFSAPESDLTPERYAAETIPVTYAGFFSRFVAAFVDGIILIVLNVVLAFVSIAASVMIGGGDSQAASEGAGILVQLAGIVLGWLYPALQESSAAQATLGKRAVGIRVTDLDGRRISFGRASGRYVAKIPSALLLMIGFLMQPFTPRKQALHDILAGTVVIKH